MSQYKSQIQNMFLSQARKKHQKVELVLETGTVLRGKLKAYDQFSVTLGFKDQSEVIYKSSIIYMTILPSLRVPSYDRKERSNYRDDGYRRSYDYYDDEDSDDIDYEENTRALNSYRKLGDDSDKYNRENSYRRTDSDGYRHDSSYRRDGSYSNRRDNGYKRDSNEGYSRRDNSYRRNDNEGYRRDNSYRRNDDDGYRRNSYSREDNNKRDNSYQKPYYRKNDDDFDKPLNTRKPYQRRDDDDPPPPKKVIVKRY